MVPKSKPAIEMTDESSQSAAEDRPSLIGRIRSLFGFDEQSVREDLEEVLDESTADSELTTHERTMLKNVLRLHDVRVKDIMIPRADIIAVSMEKTLGEVLALFRAAEHSRLPVYGETLDDPRGMVHIRDFVDHIATVAEFTIDVPQASSGAEETPPSTARYGRVDFSATLASAKITRNVLFVPGSMPALDLLVKMQASRTHMALVIDEYGGTDGLVSLEDIVEVVVGDIEDEHDDVAEVLIEPGPDGSFVLAARASLEEVEAALGHRFQDRGENDDIETIGGLIIATAGRVPARGEILTLDREIECTILDADPRRLKRIRLRPAPVSDAVVETR